MLSFDVIVVGRGLLASASARYDASARNQALLN